MLVSVKEIAPEVFSFCYFILFQYLLSPIWKHHHLPAEGIQQGDPLGPLLFCLTIHSLVSELMSELKYFYLYDGTIAGTESDLG